MRSDGDNSSALSRLTSAQRGAATGGWVGQGLAAPPPCLAGSVMGRNGIPVHIPLLPSPFAVVVIGAACCLGRSGKNKKQPPAAKPSGSSAAAAATYAGGRSAPGSNAWTQQQQPRPKGPGGSAVASATAASQPRQQLPQQQAAQRQQVSQRQGSTPVSPGSDDAYLEVGPTDHPPPKKTKHHDHFPLLTLLIALHTTSRPVALLCPAGPPVCPPLPLPLSPSPLPGALSSHPSHPLLLHWLP